MNDDTVGSILNRVSALELNRPEIYNDIQDDLKTIVSHVIKQQMNISNLVVLESVQSMGSAVGGIRGHTPSITTTTVSTYSLTEKYFKSLNTDESNYTKKDIEILAADILEFCSDEEVDELIARITSDSEYLSRKGYNSINLKGD